MTIKLHEEEETLTFAKPRSFFYHFNRPSTNAAGGEVRFSLHVAGRCLIVSALCINVPTQTKVNKTQPRAVVVGKASHVTIKDGVATIHS